MKIRGERECQACGACWSYYEVGSVECPDCGSLVSVGVGERSTHTDAATALDLSAHRARFGDARSTLPADGVDELKKDLREYTRKRGFIRGGELRSLDDTYLAASELLEAVDVYDRLRDPTDRDSEYLLTLLGEAETGERPPAESVPDGLYEARGMAAVRAVDEYRSDLIAFLDELEASGGKDENPEEPGARAVNEANANADVESPSVSVTGDAPHSRIARARALLERLRDRMKRIEALSGDVPPAEADALVDAADGLGEYVRTGKERAADRVRSRLTADEL
jgi:hypothetical protein